MADVTPAMTDEDRRNRALAGKWIQELTISERAQQKWLTRAQKIIKRYKRERSDTDQSRGFALLWSNTETLRPAVYARPPQPVVSRRFKDEDPIGRVASEVLERALTYSVDAQNLDGTLRDNTLDFVLIARAQSWERYVPTYGDEVTPTEVPVVQITTDAGVCYRHDATGEEFPGAEEREGAFYAQPKPYRPVVFEESVTDYVNWADFGHSVSRTWDEVTYVWRRVYMDREALIQRFGEKLGKLIPLDWGPVEQGRTGSDTEARQQKRAAIYEIWDKTSKQVFWISKSWSSRPLDVRDDPLQLKGFFPCPKPLLGTTANDSLIPVPDYVFYQDQAEEIDELTARIGQLQKALKVKGFFAAVEKTNLNNLFNADNNVFIPVPEWTPLKEAGGLSGMIEWMPIDKVTAALQSCISLRAQLLEDVYQITGVADILRGASDPRETAKAQSIKAQWGPMRIRDRQNELARFARDIIRIKGEVIAEKFSFETLRAMTGVKLPTAEEKAQAQAMYDQGKAQYEQAVMQAQVSGQQPPPPPPVPPELEEVLKSPTWEDVKALLEDNAIRAFRVDIETDSTIEPNETEEKAQATEFITALSGMVAQWGPAIQAQPVIAPMAAEIIKWGVRKFRAGRSVEDVIDQTMDKIAEMASQPTPGQDAAPPPDKTAVEVQALKNQQEQIKQQGENERAQLEAQVQGGDQMLRQQELQAKLYVVPRDPNPQVGV
jgi:hypothetical protein